jgi:hypothetical protein
MLAGGSWVQLLLAMLARLPERDVQGAGTAAVERVVLEDPAFGIVVGTQRPLRMMLGCQ